MEGHQALLNNSENIEQNNPLISVIIPVFKVEEFLNRCIESVVKQTYINLEIILVDDGSPDECPRICDEWAQKDTRIIVIHKKNGGLSSARNAGINISSGKYITFIDSDDWVSKDYVEYLYNLLIYYDADLSIASYVCASKYNQNMFEHVNIVEKCITGRDFLLKILKVNTQENVQYAWGKMYKNFKKTDIRYPEGLIDEDVPTIFKYATVCENVAISNKLVYAYYENQDSILRKRFNKARFDLLEVWKIIVDYAEKNCDQEIKEYSRVNLYRANFGILCNIATEDCLAEDIGYIQTREKEALQVVRENKKELLRFPMPLSRKIVVVGFSLCYPLSKKILRYLRRSI